MAAIVKSRDLKYHDTHHLPRVTTSFQQSHSPWHHRQQPLKGLPIPPWLNGQWERPETNHVWPSSSDRRPPHNRWNSTPGQEDSRDTQKSVASVGEDTLDETAPRHFSQPQGTSYPGRSYLYPLVLSPDCPACSSQLRLMQLAHDLKMMCVHGLHVHT